MLISNIWYQKSRIIYVETIPIHHAISGLFVYFF